MNLQTKLNLVNFFPFGFGNSRADEYLKSPKENISQEAESFEAGKIEPKQKNNLVLSQKAIAVIGRNGKRRFDEFKDYPNGWYGGKGKKTLKKVNLCI